MKTLLSSVATVLLLFAFAYAPSNAQGQLVSEDFSYPDDSPLSSQASWASHSGTAGDLLVTGGRAVVQHGSSEDVSIAFPDVNSGILTATFDITVNANEDITGIGDFPDDYEYFAHFFADGTFNFRARLSVVPSTGQGNYSLGLSSTTNVEEAMLTNGFNFGDTVGVELSLDVTTGVASLTVNGETIVGTSGNPGETMNLFALRQSLSTHMETVTIDNLVITGGDTPVAIKGDVDMDGDVDFDDIPAFIAVLQSGLFQAEADCDCNTEVDFGDIPAFITILQTQ